ncbi:unnamed protein product [marine sediment metagenome]|uniref:Uncharacterized protein n=1 Tax=marine sediment metagenome TaxID=412755 RepID=X1MLU8_9ZZZZ
MAEVTKSGNISDASGEGLSGSSSSLKAQLIEITPTPGGTNY